MEKNISGEKQRPKVGIGVLIQNQEGKVLLGLRLGTHGAGSWGFPGGHLEFGETVFETAKREVKEETGLETNRFELFAVADELGALLSEGKHYLCLGVKAEYAGGEPQVMEPNKCQEWGWFALDALPEKMFEGTALVLNCFKAGKLYKHNEN